MPMLESLFNKITTFEKKTPTHVFSCEICEIYKNTYCEEHCERLLNDSTLYLAE